MTTQELNPAIFRAYDVRGNAKRDLYKAAITDIAHAFADRLREEGARRIAVGRDVRPSSPGIAATLIKVLVGAGFEVIQLGPVSSPMLYFAVFEMDLDGGVMITASHNPSPDNGMKLLIGKRAMSGADIQDLYRRASQAVRVRQRGGAISDLNIMPQYLDRLANDARLGSRKLKVALDGGNGMSGPSLVGLLDRLGVEHVDLYCDPDGRFPNHHPDPTQLDTLEDLRELILREKCDFGMAFDGDGDRIGVLDEQGRVLHGDRILMIFAQDLLNEEPGAKIVGEVKGSEVLFDQIRIWGGEPIMSRVGHSFIKQTMIEEDALLAGEMSGHMFFRHRYYGFDDAVYAALRLLEIASHQSDESSFSELLKGVPNPVSTPEIRFECPDDIKFAVVDRVVEHFRVRHRVVDIDGARVLFANGWGLVRASNTQPALVMRFEAGTEADLQQYQSEVTQAVEDALSQARGGG
jgi:phosphomannomutase/phosphoglucomutase